MGILARSSLYFTVSIFLSAAAFAGTCTTQDYKEMREAGFTAQEIREICFEDTPQQNRPRQAMPQNRLPNQQQQIPYQQPQQQFQQMPLPNQSIGTNCRTELGVCSLAHLPPTPLGTPCYCLNRFSGLRDPGYIAY